MKMKLNALTLAVAAAGFAGTAAQASDAVMFPYVVNSATVTTIVTVVDKGTAATPRYNSAGVAGNTTGFNRLHWHLSYKADANATNNLASCTEGDFYLPSSPNDIQTVDLGGKFGSTTKGVLFSDPSVNNNWNAGTPAATGFMLGRNAGAVQRGALFVNNADGATVGSTTGNTASFSVYGEAMVFEFGSGAAWGYQAAQTDGGATNDATFFFDTINGAGYLASNGVAAVAGGPTGVLTFMPPAEVITKLFITPVANDGNSMLGQNGSATTKSGSWQTAVSLSTQATAGSAAGVAFDRDENLISGSVPQPVRCVGAVDVQDMISSAAKVGLANGGWANVVLQAQTAPSDNSFYPTDRAFVTKLEYSSGANKFNGEAVTGTFNNAFIMR